MPQTILIVDDSDLVRGALRQIINEQVGWRVCGEATNGTAGVSAAARLKPDVVVLDFSMPVMNGIDAAVQIKKLVPEARILMLTSFALDCVHDGLRPKPPVFRDQIV